MKSILAAIAGLLFGAGNNVAKIPTKPVAHSKGRYRSNQRQKRKARRQAWAAGDRRAFK